MNRAWPAHAPSAMGQGPWPSWPKAMSLRPMAFGHGPWALKKNQLERNHFQKFDFEKVTCIFIDFHVFLTIFCLFKSKVGFPGPGSALESFLNALGYSAAKYQPRWSHGDPFQLKKSASHGRPEGRPPLHFRIWRISARFFFNKTPNPTCSSSSHM